MSDRERLERLLERYVEGRIVGGESPSVEELCGEAPELEQRKEGLRYTGTSYKYIYRGVLPALEQVQVVASLKAHTVRVTGLLPSSQPRQANRCLKFLMSRSGGTTPPPNIPIITMQKLEESLLLKLFQMTPGPM